MATREQLQAKTLFDVEGCTAVVTGGAAGIGLAYAEVMAANGANVTLVDADSAAVDQAVARLSSAGSVIEGAVVDVTDRAQLHATLTRVAARAGRLDAVFANAGITAGPGFLTTGGVRDPAGAIENVPERLWQNVIDTNLTSVFTTVRACVEPMRKQGRGGSIIATTSIAGLRPSAVVGTPYMIAKAAAAHLVRQAALELAVHGIRVNAIAPGPFATRITSPELTAIWSRALPVRRIASTEEIKGLALYLASGASRFVTGAQFVIDGGSTLGRADPQ